MTAEEIRSQKFESDDGAWESARWLREIAAQQAEKNELFRSEQKRQIELAEENRQREAERMAVFSGMKETQTAIADSITKPIPGMRPPLPPPKSGMVIHRGCILDDGEKIVLAMEDGPIELSPEDQARIRAIITPVSKSKPQ
jgi:hypothetical protein